jgi:hypothetical protein
LFISFVLAALAPGARAASSAEDPAAELPATRTERLVEGWKVRVDDRLLAAPNEALGRNALQLLQAELADIASVVATDRLEKLRAVPIVLDLNHGALRIMQYHPSAEWLAAHGYARELARCVHIPVAAGFIDPRHHHEQPWCVLHEVAHAYHDQVLGFDEPRIHDAWEQFKASGHGEKVLHIRGHRTRHYALTDQKEFFAEMSEAYFGMNDFFPFNQAELKEAEPDLLALLKTIWGPTP